MRIIRRALVFGVLAVVTAGRPAAAQTVTETRNFYYTPSTPKTLFKSATPGRITAEFSWTQQLSGLSTIAPYLGLALIRPNGTVATTVTNNLTSPISLSYDATSADGPVDGEWSIALLTVASRLDGKITISHPATPAQQGWDIALDSVSVAMHGWPGSSDRPASTSFDTWVRNAGTKTLTDYQITCTAQSVQFIRPGPVVPLAPGGKTLVRVFRDVSISNFRSGPLPASCEARLGEWSKDMFDANLSNNALQVTLTVPPRTTETQGDLAVINAALRSCSSWLPPTEGINACVTLRFNNMGADITTPFDIECSYGPQKFKARVNRLIMALQGNADSVVLNLPAGPTILSCLLDANAEVIEINETNNSVVATGVVYPAGARFRYDLAMQHMDSVLWLDRDGSPYMGDFDYRFGVTVRNTGDHPIRQSGVTCTVGGIRMYGMIEEGLADGQTNGLTMQPNAVTAPTSEGVQPMKCYTSITQPSGYMRDANTSNDTMVANVRVASIRNMPYAELLAVRTGGYDGARVDLDVRYRINPALATYSTPSAKFRICFKDVAGASLAGRYTLDSLVHLERTLIAGRQTRISATWTDTTTDAPILAVVRAEIVSDSVPPSSTSCTTGPQLAATQSQNPRGPLYAAREFRVTDLGWANPATMTPPVGGPITIVPNIPGFGPPPARPPRPGTDTTATPPKRRPPTRRPPNVPPSDASEPLAPGKAGAFRITVPTGAVSGQAGFVCQNTDGKLHIAISMNGGGMMGAIGGTIRNVGTGSYEISEDSERGLTIGFAHIEAPVASYAATSGTITITEWTKTVLRGTFRYAGETEDAEGVMRRHSVSGAFAAVPMFNCIE